MRLKKQKNSQASGEPMVWMTAMGLSMGVLMILGLLALIFYKGLEVFWPKHVAEIHLKSEDGNGERLLGEIILQRDRSSHKSSNENDEGSPLRETQIFMGNKEVLGQAFRFVEQDKIKKISYPESVIKLERREYGNAMGFPQAIYQADQELIPLKKTELFEKTLHQLVKTYNARWEEIRHIEKDQIGKINYEMEELELEKKQLEEQNTAAKNAQAKNRLQELESSQKTLQEKYQKLADQAKKLREAQQGAQLEILLANGQSHKIEVSQILEYYYPNQLSTWGRVGMFFHKIWLFLSQEPREANTEGGVFPAFFGTLVMTLLMTIVVVPFGVMAAIYLKEYAKQGPLVRTVRIAVNNLAGVPSIVFGVFGMGFFVYMVGGTIDQLFFSNKLPTPTFGTGGLLWASLTLALMTVPVVIVATEEALGAVSQNIREGALGCGASKWQMIQKIILPASAPGILTGAILAMARGAGEVAPLMLVGVVKLAPTLPINSTFPYIHLDQKFMHLGFHIYDLGFQSPDSEAAKPIVFATTLLLILLVLVLNLGAIILRERLRKKYASGKF